MVRSIAPLGRGAGVWESADEAELVVGLRQGDPTCAETLVGTHAAPMLAVARRLLRDEEDARDCVQDALVRALQNIASFEGRASLKTWLHRIVVNCALMHLRKRESQAEQSLDELMPKFDQDGYLIGPTGMADTSIDDLLDRSNVRRLVHCSIDRLPDSLRTVLLLRDIEGYDTEEVAKMLDISAGAAKVRLHRARTALRKMLEPVFQGQVP